MAEIKNLRKAAQRIKKAIKSQENIIIVGDADLDGVASVIVMEETLKTLGGNIAAVYFINREEEGYGLNKTALKFLAKYAPGLLLLLDSGMSSFKEIARAETLGFETIIIDHHEPLISLPPALIIVNPKQRGDNYPFKSLAACGVTFKLARVLLSQGISKKIEQSFLELVALATIADLMPQRQDNLFFIEKGLESLLDTCRPGLRALVEFFLPENSSAKDLAQKIVSILQLTDFHGHLTESYMMLTFSDEKESSKFRQLLLDKHQKRQELFRSFLEEIQERVAVSPSSLFIFEGGKEIPSFLTGNLASKLCNKFKKPTFIFSIKNDVSRGSVRTPKGINSLVALQSCRDLLEIYGGHVQASGFTVKSENLEKFKQCLTAYFQKS